jgi:excisionase family DNA binding protein
MNDRLLTLQEVAARCSVHRTTVRRWIDHQLLPHVDLSMQGSLRKSIRVPESALVNFIESRFTPAAPLATTLRRVDYERIV